MTRHNKVLILGSGHSGREVNDYPYVFNGWIIWAVNHAWQLCDDWSYWVCSSDYTGPRPTLHEKQTHISEYGITLDRYGTHLECGYSITLATAYNALWTCKPTTIAFLGCDMIYEPDETGHTHFYGIGEDIKNRGISDPDRMVENVKQRYSGDNYLEHIYNRFGDIAYEEKCSVMNFSKSPTTRLPYFRVQPELK